MSETNTYIFTLIYNGFQLIKVAVTLNHYDNQMGITDNDCINFLEDDSQKRLISAMPEHYRDGYTVGNVEEISGSERI